MRVNIAGEEEEEEEEEGTDKNRVHRSATHA